jgi:hypothetical protein
VRQRGAGGHVDLDRAREQHASVGHDMASVGVGEVGEFVVDQAQNVYRIWEVTDPTHVGNVPFTVDGTQKRFRLGVDSLRLFIAFRDANYLVPTGVGPVPTQNLHATAIPTDLVIVCPPEFLGSAQQLAQRRMNEGLQVALVTPQQVFNEFSSGARDATAIKRYMRMLYDKAGTDPLLLPRYLLLFGDGSFNNISLNFNNQNWIPTYQTEDALDPSKSYTSDDYFGLLDVGEGESTGDLVDIGIGRLCVSSSQQAQEVVSKLLGYDSYRLLSSTGDNCPRELSLSARSRCRRSAGVQRPSPPDRSRREASWRRRPRRASR